MGLCKCPKRKVTNQFCYEHRVNVCEYCIVSHHPKCIVKSYLLWLQDCDYDRNCTLCNVPLENDDCIRLMCFHVFHWDCLDNYARRLPATTAPAGYGCPSCGDAIIPRSNDMSPVADFLREKISSVNWARIGLELPLLSNEERKFKPDKSLQASVVDSSNTGYISDKPERDVVVYMNDSNNFGRNEYPVNVPRRVHFPENIPIREERDDIDEKKYLRKRFLGLSWRNFNRLQHCGKFLFMKLRRPFFLIFFIIVVILLISIYGRITAGGASIMVNSGDLRIDNRVNIEPQD